MPVRYRGRIEALAVVLDPEAPVAPAASQVEPDLPSAGVLDDVVEGLLGDPVQPLLDLEWQPIIKVRFDDDREADAALQGGGVGPQRAHESVLLDVARSKLEDQGAHLSERFALELAQLAQLLAGRIGVTLEEELHGTGHEGHREESL